MVFDLGRGLVRVTPQEPQAIVPLDLLVEMLSASENQRSVGKRWGVELVRRAAARRPARTLWKDDELTRVVDFVGGEIAISGLGGLRIERWGKALLLVLDPCPLPRTLDGFVLGLFEGIVEQVGERPVSCTVIDRADDLVRVLISNAGAARRAETMMTEGYVFTEIVARLQEGSR